MKKNLQIQYTGIYCCPLPPNPLHHHTFLLAYLTRDAIVTHLQRTFGGKGIGHAVERLAPRGCTKECRQRCDIASC